jgi:two-component system cell cycle sensor histidine kinase/response regulator CckA
MDGPLQVDVPLRVLIVEDSFSDAALEVRTLEAAGYRVTHVVTETADGMKAALAGQAFDIVLADVNLPQFDAYGALAVLKESGLDIPCVIVSGSIGDEDAVSMIHAGASDYVLKDKLVRLSFAVERSLRDAEDGRKRRRSEDDLRRARFSIDHASDYTLWINPDGRFVDVSESAGTRLGYSRDELLTMSIFDVTVGLSPEAWPERWRRLLKHGSLVFEQEHRTKGGEIFPVEISSTVFEHAGRDYSLAIVRDVTVRKRAEEERLVLERQLQHSQKLESLGVLAGGIAHDFNNILTSVLGHAELALCELPPSAPVRENLLEITAASRRAAALCRQMLAYSGRGQFVIESIDLRTFVEDMLGLLKSAISKKALLNLNLETTLPLLEVDPSQLSQVIMNLVINASEAIGERSGVISIFTGARECSAEYLGKTYAHENSSPGLYLTLEVSDTGCGMDAQTRARLFEPFFTTKFTGRGLGLAAVLGIVRGHKGALELESKPGKGTTFRVLLPASEAKKGASLQKTGGAPAADWRGEGMVLLVDDEETIRALGTRMLASLGFAVLTAADGYEALEVYRAHMAETPLVLLDLTMPRMDGEETFRELRALDPSVRVVMSSGYSEQDVTSRFAGKGLVGFVQKPYTLAELAERLRAALTPFCNVPAMRNPASNKAEANISAG